MRFPAGRILVFARRPRAGEVKTRLIPELGAEGAARLHASLLRHALGAATGRGATARTPALCPVELWCTPTLRDPFFRACADEFSVRLRTQRGSDLGARMRGAFRTVLREARFAVLVGSDCPGLDVTVFGEALQRLDAGIDAVFTPALDGGYVLIGLRRSDPALFEGIPWGTGEVMARTRERLDGLGWSWHETRALRDIDEPADLGECERYGLYPASRSL